jgi:hypothetical protein
VRSAIAAERTSNVLCMRIPLGRSTCLFLELRHRCRHDVVGICPRCYPTEARTRRNRKLALAIAWLDRIRTPDPHIRTLDQVQKIAADAIDQVADLT